jgi:hypothetical protein
MIGCFAYVIDITYGHMIARVAGRVISSVQNYYGACR